MELAYTDLKNKHEILINKYEYLLVAYISKKPNYIKL